MGLLFSDEVSGDALAFKDVGKPLGISAVGDVDFDACFCGTFHGFEFRTHAAHGEFTFVILDVTECGIDIADLGDELLVGGIKQAIDTSKEDHAFGADQFRDLDRKHIIVPEAEFADRDGVVFVDDGKDAGFFEEAIECVEKVGGTGFGLDVLGSKEDLGDEDVEVRKQRAISAHQASLADRSAGLAGSDIIGVFGKAHGGDPGAHRTR